MLLSAFWPRALAVVMDENLVQWRYQQQEMEKITRRMPTSPHKATIQEHNVHFSAKVTRTSDEESPVAKPQS